MRRDNSGSYTSFTELLDNEKQSFKELYEDAISRLNKGITNDELTCIFGGKKLGKAELKPIGISDMDVANVPDGVYELVTKIIEHQEQDDENFESKYADLYNIVKDKTDASLSRGQPTAKLYRYICTTYDNNKTLIDQRSLVRTVMETRYSLYNKLGIFKDDQTIKAHQEIEEMQARESANRHNTLTG